MRTIQLKKYRFMPAMNPRIVAILLMSFGVAMPVRAGTFAFPSTSSAAVCGGGSASSCNIDHWCANCTGWFFSKSNGHQVSQTFVDTRRLINGAVLDINIPHNGLAAGNSVTWALLINGTNVGSLEVDSGFTGEMTLDTSFDTITGPTVTGGNSYEIVFKVTSTAAYNSGAHMLTYSGWSPHQIVLSYKPVSAADSESAAAVSEPGPRVKVTKRPAQAGEAGPACETSSSCAEGNNRSDR